MDKDYDDDPKWDAAFVRIRRVEMTLIVIVIVAVAIVALALFCSSTAHATTITITQDAPGWFGPPDDGLEAHGELVTFTITEQFDATRQVFARLYWTWCYADYQGAAQTPLGGGWTPIDPLWHQEVTGGLDYAELWFQTREDWVETAGTVTAQISVFLKQPERTRFEVFSYESGGTHEVFWVQPGQVVPEPSTGWLLTLGLLGMSIVASERSHDGGHDQPLAMASMEDEWKRL